MKKKEFLTEAKRKAIIADKEKAIIESFAKTFVQRGLSKTPLKVVWLLESELELFNNIKPSLYKITPILPFKLLDKIPFSFESTALSTRLPDI